MSSITYRGDYGNEEITLELLRPSGVNREAGDIALSCMAAAAGNLPLRCCFLVRADGQIQEWYVEWCHTSDNHYWQFAHLSEEWALGNNRYPFEEKPIAGHPPTEAQVDTLAKIYLHKIRPFGLNNGLGGRVCGWAFQGLTIADVEKRWNEGNRVFLSGPEPPLEDDGEIARQEAALENAVEEGRLPGAMPVDL